MSRMLLRQAEVEKLYRLSKNTLYRWIRMGVLTDHRTVGKHRRYDRAEIERVLSVSSREGNEDGSP